MSQISKFIKYYRKCYRADNRDLSIWNVLKVDDAYWLDSDTEELASGEMPRLPVPLKEGEALYKKRKIHVREKNLIYGVIFCTGKLSGLSGFVSERNICSPLIYYDADIELEEGKYYYSIDINTPHLNTPLLSEIVANEADGGVPPEFPVLEGGIDNSKLSGLIKWLDDNTILEETPELFRFPKIYSKKDYKQIFDNQQSLRVIPAASLLLVDRPKASRGILHELKLLAESTDYSAPLKSLFTGVNETVAGKKIDVDNIPGLLSHAQIEALDIAREYAIGLVSGPPGTGKSYTISAIALDRLLQGERVLIVSETDQALDVINDKLASDFHVKDVVLRAGKKEFLKKLKVMLDSWLKYGVEATDNALYKATHQQLKASKKLIAEQEKQFFKRVGRSIKWGRVLAKINNDNKPSYINNIRKRYVLWRIKNSSILWNQIDELQGTLKKRDKNATQYLKLHTNSCVESLLNKNRSQLAKFNMAIRARTSQKQLSLHDEIDYEIIFKAFPVWLASLDIVHHVLPLKKHLFDLVIIDEATQCNIASVLPVLQRAKRVLIVGDSKQLKHVSFLPYKKERNFFNNSGLDINEYESYSYRKNSILDLVSNAIKSQSAVTMLNEHYRSKPDLIAFSNRKFYESRLKIMQHRPDEYLKGNIKVIKTRGNRDKKGVNKLEAQIVIQQLEKIIQQSESNVIKPGIGILSPFREQVNYLQKLLNSEVSIGDIEKHAIRVATPYGFQGDEKDYMLMSLSIDDESRRAAAYLNKEDMFNVAITRARQRKYIFISVDPALLPTKNLFRQYMQSLENFAEDYYPVSEVFDSFQNEVCNDLHRHGVETRKAYPVAGRNVDILCTLNNKSLAIDLIGFPGEHEDFLELNTYYLFSRAGLQVFPLSYGIWQVDRNMCISAIKNKMAAG